MTANAEETKSLSMEFDLPYAPAKVWRALTEPALLAKWLMTSDMQLAVGKAFTFKMPQSSPQWDGVVHCEMKEFEPNQRLRYSWGGAGLDATIVTWTLTATKTGGTLLRLDHTGFPADKGHAQYYEGAKWGWQRMAGQQLGAVLAELP